MVGRAAEEWLCKGFVILAKIDRLLPGGDGLRMIEKKQVLSTEVKMPLGVLKHAVKIPLAKPVLNKEMERAAVNALVNERFVLGESVYRFEEEFAEYCCVDYAVSMSSGTAALAIALLASGTRQGQQVITSPASFIATSNAALHVQAVPVFADIDLQTYTVDPERVKKAVNSKTRAIVPVHLYGYPADMDPLREVADRHRLILIEDACQAHGAHYWGRKAGSLGDVGCFSFYSSKNMTVAGDGGMLVTNDRRTAEKAAKLRDCGRKAQYVHDMVGYTARLNTVNAAIGRVQLKYLDGWNEKRRRNAEAYNRLLSDLELTLPPNGSPWIKPVYHLYVVRTRARERLRVWLESNGIQCGVHYCLPIHLQPVYRRMYGFKKGSFSNTEELCRTCLSLPMFPELTSSEIGFVSEKIHDFFD
jgi:perosamine synthetase